MFETATLPEHFLNYGSILLNLFFIFQLKSIQSSGEKAKYWKEEYEETKNELEKEQKRGNIYEAKYHQISRENEYLKGQLKSCNVHQEPLAL